MRMLTVVMSTAQMQQMIPPPRPKRIEVYTSASSPESNRSLPFLSRQMQFIRFFSLFSIVFAFWLSCDSEDVPSQPPAVVAGGCESRCVVRTSRRRWGGGRPGRTAGGRRAATNRRASECRQGWSAWGTPPAARR